MAITQRCVVLLFLSIGITHCEQMSEELVALYEHAKPLHIQVRVPDELIPEANQAKFTSNEKYSGFFQANPGCSENRTELKVGDYGSIVSPNYPKNYPPNMACEWQLESEPGTRIEAVFFDVYTQPWFFAYFDYVMVARNGDFSNVDRMSGDMNGKTPMVVLSDENVLGLRFRSSSLFNFRGFKMQYLVIPDPNASEKPAVPSELERPVFDGVCGQPSPQPQTTTGAPTEYTSTFSTEDAQTMFSSTTTEEIAPVTKPETTEAPAEPAPGESAPGQPAPVEPEQEQPAPVDPAPDQPTPAGRNVPVDPPKPAVDPNIIGGSETLKYAYPWMAALLIDNKHFCGGSLIDNQHIMTAAHCTNGAQRITALLGTHNIKAPPGTEDSRRLFNVTKANIFQHPDYNENTISHDISILRLPEPITFTDRIKPVCLPNRRYLPKFFTDEEVKVSGWGKPADDAPGVSPFLKEADVRVMPNSQCRIAFRGIVTGNLICVATTRLASPCRGDSGGPLMLKEDSPLGPYFTQLGIVSFGSLTCERGLPVGFTRVTAFMDYISEVTGKQVF